MSGAPDCPHLVFVPASFSQLYLGIQRKGADAEKIILALPKSHPQGLHGVQSTFIHITEGVLALCPQIQQN